MIKSVNYQVNKIASIEISDPEDIETLGDSYGYGSTARVTGQISAEYIYTPDGWISISSSPAGSGALVVHVQLDESVFTCDKTAGEMYAAAQNGLVTVLQDQGGGYYSVGLISGFSFDENGYYFQVTFISTTRQVDFEATEANDYPTGQEGGASPE